MPEEVFWERRSHFRDGLDKLGREAFEASTAVEVVPNRFPARQRGWYAAGLKSTSSISRDGRRVVLYR